MGVEGLEHGGQEVEAERKCRKLAVCSRVLQCVAGGCKMMQVL